MILVFVFTFSLCTYEDAKNTDYFQTALNVYQFKQEADSQRESWERRERYLTTEADLCLQ